MNDIYLDVLKKFNYHKELILKEFIKNNIYPDNELIQSRINNIDLYLSIFKHNNVVTGEVFNTNEFNKAIEFIYKDIVILYELLQEIQVERLHKLQNYIASYLHELHSITDTYKKRADLENTSTTLGKTLLFQNNQFKIDNDNATTILKLKDVEIEDAASIACIANINNIKTDNMLFVLTDSETNKEYKIAPYNFSEELLTMPGKKNISYFNIEMTEDQKMTGPIYLNLNKDIDTNNKYTILCGKNKIFINYKDENRFEIDDSPSTLGTKFYNKNTYINFYVLNGNTVSFKFNKRPISANFPIDDLTVTNLDSIHHFYIECDDEFTFEIELDKGDIYAIKENGIINNDKLYYTGTNDVKDFNIIEEAKGKAKTYHTELRIYNNNDNNIDIDNIVIKEMEGDTF